jgi:hypothetical protein
MPICDLTRPMILNNGHSLTQYGVGDYWFDSGTAYSDWVMAHCRNGKPENGDVGYEHPGPEPVLLGIAGARRWLA